MPDDEADRVLRESLKCPGRGYRLRLVKPIYLTDHDIDVMDRQTKKGILAHNKAWQANCQKENAELK